MAALLALCLIVGRLRNAVPQQPKRKGLGARGCGVRRNRDNKVAAALESI
jgi:hypothetical protein